MESSIKLIRFGPSGQGVKNLAQASRQGRLSGIPPNLALHGRTPHN